MIGTGSSGTQMIPIVAREAAHLTVFQRTPNFSIPASNGPISDEGDAEVKAQYRKRRRRALNSPSGLGYEPNPKTAVEASPAERRSVFEKAWPTLGFGFVLAYPDLVIDQQTNDYVSDFVREKIAEKVQDPVGRDMLTPRDHPFGTKRPPVDSGYFETFNRDDVELVDIRKDPIAEITPSGNPDRRRPPRTRHHRVRHRLRRDDRFAAAPGDRGAGGRTLRERWATGPQTYLGLGVHGFPNMFIIAGPQSPSLLSNVLLSIEQHVDWLTALIEHASEHAVAEIEADADAERDWVENVRRRAEQTLYPRARSYYMGDEVADKPRVFTPLSEAYAATGGSSSVSPVMDTKASRCAPRRRPQRSSFPRFRGKLLRGRGAGSPSPGPTDCGSGSAGSSRRLATIAASRFLAAVGLLDRELGSGDQSNRTRIADHCVDGLLA